MWSYYICMTHLQWLAGSASDAEDIVQEACMRAYRGIRGFRGDNVIGWTEGDTSYWATSNIGIADLEGFVRKFRAAIPER